jgi:GMP synthase (glutamine-hydrolysing)
MGHEDRVARLPEGAIELAFSQVCRNQAFRMADAPVFGTQFHTELSPERLVERLSVYRKYTPDDGEFEAVKAGVRPTPDAERIMRNFLESVARSVRRRRGGPE